MYPLASGARSEFGRRKGEEGGGEGVGRRVEERNCLTSLDMSVFMGVGHGVDRAIGVIEGNSWYFGIPMSVWLLFCCYVRYPSPLFPFISLLKYFV